MGADPTTSRVTGECSTVELQPHKIYPQVPMSGIEPLFRAYESLVLPLNYTGFHLSMLREQELHLHSEVMSLVTYY